MYLRRTVLSLKSPSVPLVKDVPLYRSHRFCLPRYCTWPTGGYVSDRDAPSPFGPAMHGWRILHDSAEVHRARFQLAMDSHRWWLYELLHRQRVEHYRLPRRRYLCKGEFRDKRQSLVLTVHPSELCPRGCGLSRNIRYHSQRQRSLAQVRDGASVRQEHRFSRLPSRVGHEVSDVQLAEPGVHFRCRHVATPVRSQRRCLLRSNGR